MIDIHHSKGYIKDINTEDTGIRSNVSSHTINIVFSSLNNAPYNATTSSGLKSWKNLSKYFWFMNVIWLSDGIYSSITLFS